MTEKINEYPLVTKLKNKNIQFRKWKVKDKKNILQSKDNAIQLKHALVYNCLKDKKIALTSEEYKFLLFKIRSESINSPILYNFSCDSCNEEFEYNADLNEIMKPTYIEKSLISVKNNTFKLQNIQNREFYENSIQNLDESELDLVDFIFHIKSYNDDDTLGFDDLNEIINNMNIDVFSEIFSEWNKIKFKINNVYSVKCPVCGAYELYEFDDLPGFFPDDWDL